MILFFELVACLLFGFFIAPTIARAFYPEQGLKQAAVGVTAAFCGGYLIGILFSAL